MGRVYFGTPRKSKRVTEDKPLTHQPATPPPVSRAHDRRPGVLPLAVVPVMVGQDVPQEVVPDVAGASASGRVVAAPQRGIRRQPVLEVGHLRGGQHAPVVGQRPAQLEHLVRVRVRVTVTVRARARARASTVVSACASSSRCASARPSAYAPSPSAPSPSAPSPSAPRLGSAVSASERAPG